MTEIHDILLDRIEPVAAAQMRVAGTDPGTVAEYAEAMEAGATFPAVILFHDGERYWPADGFHRIEAAHRIGRESISAEVREGGQRDAIMFACGANAAHGLRRTQADKRNAVETLLRDPEWARWSDRKIAAAAAVDHKTVAKVRRELSTPGEIPTRRPHDGEIPGTFGKPNNRTSLIADMLRSVADDALIAECRRRGLVVEPADA